jgi:molybdenum cofactor guanylyltransferase
MGIPILASRSGFTAWGVEIARQLGLTLIGRMRGQRFVCLSGEERLIRDADLSSVPEEDRRHRRKSAEDDGMTAPLGVILAGGRATRMGGGDKGLREVGGRRLIDHVIAGSHPNAARWPSTRTAIRRGWPHSGCPVLPDSLPDHPGPLAGVLAGLDWAAGQGAEAIVTAAADTPFFPPTSWRGCRPRRALGPLPCRQPRRDRPDAAPPDLRPLAGGAPGRPARGADRGLRKIVLWTDGTARGSRASKASLRSVLQRQHARGHRDRRAPDGGRA